VDDPDSVRSQELARSSGGVYARVILLEQLSCTVVREKTLTQSLDVRLS
jgi:hypothetical protein